MSQNLVTRAIILRRTNYGEADRILSVLTPDLGQITIMARSVRREKSRLAGGIELFAVCELGLVRSQNNVDGMWTLTSSKIIKFYDHIIEDYDRLQFGYQAIKGLSRISQSFDDLEIYQILQRVFILLDNSNIDLRLIKIWYYLNLAELSGQPLNLATDKNGMRLVEDANYRYDRYDRTLVFDPDNGKVTSQVIKLMRLLATDSGSLLERLATVDNSIIEEAFLIARALADEL